MRKGAEILPSTNRIITVHMDGATVNDIIQVILQADRLSRGFTVRFAPTLRRSSHQATLKAVWRLVKDNIRYRRDTGNHEIIKSPGRTWQDGYGDCKSYTVLIGSILQNLGYPYFFRVAFYDPKNPEQGHIYPIALVGERQVILDAVIDHFDNELPFWKAYDIDPGTGRKKRASLAGSTMGSGPLNRVWPLVLGAGAFVLIKGLLTKNITNDES